MSRSSPTTTTRSSRLARPRRRLARPRPADPRALRRLGDAGRAPARSCRCGARAATRLPLPLPCRSTPARARRRRRPQEHLLPRRGPARLAVRPRRRHGRPRHPHARSTRREAHLESLTGVTPRLLVADRHPATAPRGGRAGTRPAGRVAAGPAPPRPRRVGDGRERPDGTRPVIGVAFDGTGYGDDGAVWGGEVLVADYDGYERAAHLAYVRCPAATPRCATRAGWRCRTCAAPGCAWDAGRCPASAPAPTTSAALLARQLERGLRCVPTSSMGRLFDAVSSLAGVCHRGRVRGAGRHRAGGRRAAGGRTRRRVHLRGCGPRTNPPLRARRPRTARCCSTRPRCSPPTSRTCARARPHR